MNIQQNLKLVKKASQSLINLKEEQINQVLNDLADELLKSSDQILSENKKDLDRMDSRDPKFDRLKLTHERLEGIASEMRNVAQLPYPVGQILEKRTLDSGLDLSKVSVPLGVIGIIYEARPNVTFDVFSLCFKSGNACVLKGGSDAEHSNLVIVQIIKKVLSDHQLDENIVYLAPAGRECVSEILEAHEFIDIIIPRGSRGLINFVRENAKLPVIETGAGVVHVYFDESGDLKKGKNIVLNSKTRRPSVCNALDTLLVHKNRLDDLGELVLPLLHHQVELYCDEKSYEHLKNHYDEDYLKKASEEDFGREFLDYKMSIKVVSGLDEALDHISEHSSKHTESIIAEDAEVIEKYLNQVDAAAVYANASTSFTDGAQFGLGAEIGISTQKLHARGPMALNELTSYKWIARGNGQIRG